MQDSGNAFTGRVLNSKPDGNLNSIPRTHTLEGMIPTRGPPSHECEQIYTQ